MKKRKAPALTERLFTVWGESCGRWEGRGKGEEREGGRERLRKRERLRHRGEKETENE